MALMLKTASKPEPLTPTQRDCLGVIAEYWADLGRSPNYRELMAELDMASKSGVSRLVGILIAKGWLRPRRPGAKYSLELAADVTLPPEGPVQITPAGQAAIARYAGARA